MALTVLVESKGLSVCNSVRTVFYFYKQIFMQIDLKKVLVLVLIAILISAYYFIFYNK